MSHPKNQHYVPRFILRNFLVNEAKEQVSVYDKHTDRVFTTSIDNIMAENQFHDFVFDGSHLSLEPAMTKLEQSVLPVYQRIIETRRLDKTPDEKAALAFLIAFQFARTKGARRRLLSSPCCSIQASEANSGRHPVGHPTIYHAMIYSNVPG